MKTKFLLSIATLALLAACNDDSSSPAAANTDLTQTPVVDPSADPAQIDPAQTDPAQTDPAADPAQDPAQGDPAADPATDPVVTPDPVTPPPQVGGCNAIDRSTVNFALEPSPVNASGEYTYYGAELSGVDQFKYGRFEACMKMVSIPGSVSSMFLYYDDSWKKDVEPWNEIDIEVLGKGGTMWQSNIITREGDPSIKNTTSSESKPLHEFGFDATESFHLFAIVWTPEYVSWEIDSVEVRRDSIGLSRGKHADADQVAFLTEEQSLRFNLWASSSAAWVGKFTGAELDNGPKVQWIDYVRVYSYDEATKSFTQTWQDDFDGDDLSDHWSTGNWEMEEVMLSPFNVVVENGYCKMMMTRE